MNVSIDLLFPSLWKEEKGNKKKNHRLHRNGYSSIQNPKREERTPLKLRLNGFSFLTDFVSPRLTPFRLRSEAMRRVNPCGIIKSSRFSYE